MTVMHTHYIDKYIYTNTYVYVYTHNFVIYNFVCAQHIKQGDVRESEYTYTWL